MSKWVVITGGGSGIGRALAHRFSELHYSVLIVGRTEQNLKVTQFLAKNSSNIHILPINLTAESAPQTVSDCIPLYDEIQYVIHCAATTGPLAPLTTVTKHELQNVIDLNALTPMYLTAKLMKHFNPTSRVLFIGSDYVGCSSTKKCRPHLSGTYAISKTAQKIMTDYLKQEFRLPNCIGYLNPGSVDTGMYQSMMQSVSQRSGIFNTSTPSDPTKVAEFISDVLENAKAEDYLNILWDYRTSAQRSLIRTLAPIRAKL